MNAPTHSRDTEIQEAQNRFIDKLQAQSDRPLSTSVTHGCVSEGLRCQIHQGRHQAVTDLGLAMGGDNAGPTPSFYARAGIVGCVAIGIKMAAARAGLHLRRVEVSVETDFDDAALFGLGSASAAPIETRISIGIDTDEDMSTVNALVTRVLRMDPWFLALRDAQGVKTQVHRTAEEACIRAAT